MKISVITPVFNGEKTIERAILSVQKQSYKNWEHIVQNGSSTDRTSEIVKKYPNVLLISENDNGQSDAMNKAFDKSTGEVIVYLNADDEFALGAFEKVIEGFNSNIDAVIGQLIYKDENMTLIKNPKRTLSDILHYQYFNFPLNPVSYFYRREVQKKIGPFPKSNHFAMDYWFILRLYDQFTIQFVDSVLGVYYGDENNKSADVSRALNSLRKVKRNFIVSTMKFKFFPSMIKDLLLKH